MELRLKTTAWKEGWQHFWTKFGRSLYLGATFLLIGIFSFEAGTLQKSLGQPTPVVIYTAALPQENNAQTVAPESVPDSPPAGLNLNKTAPDTVPAVDCPLIGSKNSNKYHHPTSRCAKQIKVENRRCFLSAEDAAAQGYLPGCLEP